MKRFFSVLGAILVLLTFASCADNASAVKVNLTDVMAEIKEKVELPDDMMTVSKTDKLKDYYGIEAEDVVSFEVMMNSSGVQADEIVMIEAKDDQAAARVEEALKARLEDKSNQMKNYIPEQYEMLSKCSVDKSGVYVSMFLSEDAQKMKDTYNSYFKK